MTAPREDWGRIGPYPYTTFRKEKTLTWREQAASWSDLPKQPLCVTAIMSTPVVAGVDNRINLDGLLASAALTTHPYPSQWGRDGDVTLPLPLELLWVSDTGLPLWAATPLQPLGDAVDGREYWHKRTPSHRADFGVKLNAVTTAGRWKEYRVPLRTVTTDRLTALCIGNQAEVERLLASVSHIGKKGSVGYGRVARWLVEPAGDAVVADQLLALRPVPIAYYDGKPAPQHGVLRQREAWTPPYWVARWHQPCVCPA